MHQDIRQTARTLGGCKRTCWHGVRLATPHNLPAPHNHLPVLCSLRKSTDNAVLEKVLLADNHRSCLITFILVPGLVQPSVYV